MSEVFITSSHYCIVFSVILTMIYGSPVSRTFCNFFLHVQHLNFRWRWVPVQSIYTIPSLPLFRPSPILVALVYTVLCGALWLLAAFVYLFIIFFSFLVLFHVFLCLMGLLWHLASWENAGCFQSDFSMIRHYCITVTRVKIVDSYAVHTCH